MQDDNIDTIKSQLSSFLLTILSDICPGGRLVGSEYEAAGITGGQGRSFKYNINKDTWADFAVPEHKGHGIIDLYMMVHGVSFKDAIFQMKEKYLNISPEKITAREQKMPKRPTLIKPPPNITAPFQLKKYSASYTYTDQDGDPLFYIARRENPDGTKDFHPWCYSEEGAWVSVLQDAFRVPFNLHEFKENKKILIVEGEKAALAAKEALPAYTVTTWTGGSNAVLKTSWEILKDRDVLLWPDFDQPGIDCMNELASHILPIVNSLKIIVHGDPGLSSGWDAFDAFKVQRWSSRDFIEWARPRVKAIEKPKVVELPTPEEVPTIQALTLNFPHTQKKTGKPLSTIENFIYLMQQYGITIRYNVITKEEEIIIPKQSFLIDNRANASLAWVISIMAKHGMATGSVMDFVSYMTGINPYNPVAEWIKSKPWDQTSRLKDLYDTVTESPAENEQESQQRKTLKELFIRRWMVSAVAAAFNPDGVSAHGVLVFQGPQNIGKTSWFKSLVPKDLNFTNDGVLLRPDDKDSVKQAVSFWLVELGELDATFRRSDIAQLKAFLTKDKDVLRRAYARKESEYARRTVFFSSVNPKQFLQDPTGNRRFWTVECREINYKHSIDCQQLWAEVYENLYLKGEPWVLSDVEIDSLNQFNEEFTAQDSIQEKILEELDWDKVQQTGEWMTATHALLRVGIKKPLPKEVATASAIIFKKNGGRKKKSEGLMKLWVPALKPQYHKHEDF